MSIPAKQVQQQSWEIESGRKLGAMIALLIGTEGIGKSSFANDAGAAFIDIEHGTNELDIKKRIKEPEEGWTWPHVLALLRWLAAGEHKHAAVAVDTVDALESLIWKYICTRDDKANIEDYGYGKGYSAALDEWKIFVQAVEFLKLRRGIDVYLLAHATVKTFKNPEGDDFDRYQPALHDKASGLLKSRSDVVLFANYEQFARKKDPKSKVEKAKGVATERRLIYTTRTAAYDAKNRYDLPPNLPLEFAAFAAAVKSSTAATPADLRKLIEEKAEQMKTSGSSGEQARTDTLAAIKRAGDDAQKLRQLSNWASAKIDELAAAAAA